MDPSPVVVKHAQPCLTKLALGAYQLPKHLPSKHTAKGKVRCSETSKLDASCGLDDGKCRAAEQNLNVSTVTCPIDYGELCQRLSGQPELLASENEFTVFTVANKDTATVGAEEDPTVAAVIYGC